MTLVMVAAVTVSFIGCLGDDDSNNNKPIEVTVTEGAFIVNHGNAEKDISGSLTFVDFRNDNVQQNVGGISGSLSDVLVYGSKVYVVNTSENAVIVLSKNSLSQIGKFVTTKELGEEEGAGPQRLSGYEGNIYVTTNGGYVAVVDTTAYSMKNKYKVGSYPLGMAVGIVSDGTNTTATLYVANSDQGNGNGSVSKIDLKSGTTAEVKNEKLPYPQDMAVGGQIIYVLDGGKIDEAGKQVDAGVYMVENNNVSKIISDATGMTAGGYYILTHNNPIGGSSVSFSSFNVAYNVLSTLNLSGDTAYRVNYPTAIGLDPNTGYVFIASCKTNEETGGAVDSEPGFVNIYDGNGNFKKSYAVGVGPCRIGYSYGIVKYYNGEIVK